MTPIYRTLLAASLFAFIQPSASGQALSVLRVTVTLVDAEQRPTPVPRHALLISDNPATSPPRRIRTAQDGTVEVRLRPGLYTVESDQPIAFGGKAYQWTQMVEIVAGGDATLELTADNAEIVPVTAAPVATAVPAAPVENDPSFLLSRWQDSVIVLWTATARASAFVIDARGLVLTNQDVVGDATAVELQLTPSVKVAARVLAADPARDVAVLWVDATITAAIQPVSFECSTAGKSAIADGQELFTIGAPLRGPKTLTSGSVTGIGSFVHADLRLSPGSSGGPVFTADGRIVGLTGMNEEEEGRRGDARVIRIENACEALASAQKKMQEGAAPSAAHLPVEPSKPFRRDVLETETGRRVGRLNPYPMSASDFDVSFLTPVLASASHARGRERATDSRSLETGLAAGFGNWSDYVADAPPVLLVRVTPKFAEGFWTTVGRVAASTQGVSLPPIKRFRPGFARMRAFCGDAEVTPIHPFKIEQRLSETTAVREGLYVFDPGAFGPHCKSVKLVLYSEKAPERGDSRVVDPKVIDQIWQDFAVWRAPETQ